MRLAFAGRLRILLTCMDATPNSTCTRPQSRAGLVVASMNGIVTGLGSIAWGAIRKYAPPKPALVAGDDCPVRRICTNIIGSGRSASMVGRVDFLLHVESVGSLGRV